MEMSGHPPVPCPAPSLPLSPWMSYRLSMKECQAFQSVWLAVPALQVLWMLQKGGDVLPERLPSSASCSPGFHPWWVTCQFLSGTRRSMIKGDFVWVSWAQDRLSCKWHLEIQTGLYRCFGGDLPGSRSARIWTWQQKSWHSTANSIDPE